MKVWKKFSAVALALVMALALCAPAFAANPKSDDTPNASKGIDATSETASDNNTIQIAKEIIFVNGEATAVREPNITYTYTISAVEAASLSNGGNAATVTGPLVSDSTTSMTTTVKAGVIGAVSATTSTVAFADTNAKITATSGGASDRKYASFTFNPSTFTEAGIYRYAIAESVGESARADVGITQAATYNANRYLDVYVKWNTAHAALEIYGYVLFEGNGYDSLTTSSTKSAGYVNTANSGQGDVDVYTTQNLLITGATDGALADKTNDFPVTITLTKVSTLTNGIKLDFTTADGGALTTTTSDTIGNYVTMDSALSGTLKDGSTISITGIPTGSTVTMGEENNTHDSYRVKIGTTTAGADILAEDTVAANASTGTASSSTLNEKVSLFITNTLDAISPTGVTLRFAPYMAMLGAGIVALPLSLRKKEEEL